MPDEQTNYDWQIQRTTYLGLSGQEIQTVRGGSIPHSADVGRIFLSVVKTWKPNAFGLKLCSVSLT
ncbi:MAG: hypothetical protein JGK21_30700, partial [Microcoleus sp. PH2017_22_RUC_O_B]|uniref:hypothetical protein n=1 Tax=unclassified Microcoleus TaxID=2642155 RepID=UPI001D48A89E